MKIIRHVFIYCFEILIATSILTYLLSGNVFTRDDYDLMNILRDYVFSYTVYQLILLVSFKLYDSLNVDAFAAIKNQIDKFIIYAEFDKKIPQDELDEIKSAKENKSLVFNDKQRKFLDQIVELVERYNSQKLTLNDFKFYLKQESRALDFVIKTFNYGWMNSLFLKLSK